MIFNVVSDNLKNEESYKERNLYYKIFAGYFFNELIEGYENRKRDFLKVLEIKVGQPDRFFGETQKVNTILAEMQKTTLSVTFDYHPAQIFKEDKRDNRGEMSDILMLSGKYLLSIECKFLSNISFDKDVKEVQERIIKFSKHFMLEPIQILLIKKDKWHNSKQIQKLQDTPQIVPIVILFWEDLLPLISNDIVKNHLIIQLNRKNKI